MRLHAVGMRRAPSSGGEASRRATEVGILEISDPFGEGAGGDLSIRRVVAERIDGQLQAQEHAYGPGRHLRLDRQTGGDGVLKSGEECLVVLEDPAGLAPE